RFIPLLDAEQAHEALMIKERLRLPVDKLHRDGYCIPGLSAFWLEATQFGMPVAVFSLGPGVTLGSHLIDNGTQVILSREDPLTEDVKLGSVIGKSTTQLRVVFQQRFDIDSGLWRVDLASSDISFIRMRAALDHLHFDPASLARETVPNKEPILLGTHLRDLLLKGFESKARSVKHDDALHVDLKPSTASKSPKDLPIPLVEPELAVKSPSSVLLKDDALYSWAQRYQRENPEVLEDDPKFDLNASQVRAVACMLGNRLSLIQGPPGTGKSKTIVEAVRVLKKHFRVPIPLVVCTYTNVAVDNLVESFSNCGLNPLRVGFAGRVPDHLHNYTLDAKIEAHSSKPVIDEIRAKLDNAERALERVEASLGRSGSRKLTTDTSEKVAKLTKKRCKSSNLEATLAQLRRQKWTRETEMLTEIVQTADVVCTTMITSACAALQVIDFPVVFIDEASMSTEPASLIPIMRGSQHVALVGDHKQLPPVVVSNDALSGGLGYRMHPGISHFPNSEFYDYQLKDGTRPDADWTPPLSAFLPINPVTGATSSAVFLNHMSRETRRARSTMNANEAEIVCRIIEDLLLQNPNLMGKDIGVIAPYVAQIKLLTTMLREDPERRATFEDVLGKYRALEVPLVEVKTVDGFEGREKDVIIFSTVRSNAAGQIGFLADRRRLNVGLTRARRGLFVLGNAQTLMKGKVTAFGDLGRQSLLHQSMVSDGVWGRFVRYMDEHHLITQWQPTVPGAGIGISQLKDPKKQVMAL
ncbi:P-loop containing nucleoside triphosphate hydrolase protein, partial [Clavulina sp. PMI_390]